MKLKTIVLLSLFTLSAINGVAQPHAPITHPYRALGEAQVRYDRADYVGAKELLKTVLTASPSEAELTYELRGEAEFLWVAIVYHLGESEVIAQLNHYLSCYPETPYRNEVLAMIANRHYFNGEYQSSLDAYSQCDLEMLPSPMREASTLYKAICHIEVGERSKAHILLSVVLACSAELHHDAQYYMAYIDYCEGRYGKAQSIFQSLTHNPTYGDKAALYNADIHLIKGNWEQATLALNDVHDRSTAEYNRIMGTALCGLGRYTEAIAPLNNYCQTPVGAKNRTAQYLLAMAYYSTAHYALAADFFEQVGTVDDALTQNAFLHAGLCYLQIPNKARARMAFEFASAESFGISAITEQALYNYAVCLHETSYSPFAESVTVFERFLNEYPNSFYATQVDDYLVEVYMSTRSYEAALRSIAKINQPGTRILQAKQEILYHLGTQAFANAQFDGALDLLNQSLAVGNYNRSITANTYYWRGEANYRLDNFAAAEGDLKRFLAQAPQSAGESYALALYSIGYATFKQKQYATADNWFSKFLAQQLKNQPSMMGDAYNRLGDCRFYVRNFNDAIHFYTKALETEKACGDYALFQIGFVQGLQNNYTDKIATLQQLLNNYPLSAFVDDALYEQARAYVQMEQNSKAIATFTTLVNRYPESAIARKGACEIGLLYYQDDKYPEAITAYKRVITDYPGSDEAQQAQRDLRSIYLDLNQVEEYAAYIASQKGVLAMSYNEQDSLTYQAAERVYMRGDIAQARNSFTHYLQLYPTGDFCLNAHYYLGLIAYNAKEHSQAMVHFDKVLDFPHNKFSEEAMVWNSELAFDAKQYAKAYGIYKTLRATTASSRHRQYAQIGVLRCAWLLGNAEETILMANEMLGEQKLSPELINEVRYYRAKSALAIQPSVAIADLQALATDTRNIYGAEAKYLIAQYHYDHTDYTTAEQVLLAYIDASTPHLYWLARSFVLLADVYTKQGRTLEARQYLLTLQANYKANDDIAPMITQRLGALNK